MSFECVEDINEVCQVEFEPDDWMQYWDDVSGKVLRKELVEAARAEELATVRKMKVWVKVDRDQCFRDTGKPPIKLRWVDINKGDEVKPKYRSRIVAKEIKTNSRPDLFAATPPIEHIKYLIPRAASSQRRRKPTRLMVQDIKKGLLLCPGDKEELCGATRGRRRAWQSGAVTEITLRHSRCRPQLDGGIHGCVD